MKAVVADPVGGPENLKFIDLPKPEPGDGEVVVKLEASGVNYTDVYYRKGLYKVAETPVRLGSEGAGTVESAGKGASWKPGQRVAYAMARGSYAEYAAVPQNLLVEIPSTVRFEDAAAVLLQGLTAHYLTRSTFPLKSQQTALVHAAAGGAGLLIVQLAKLAGARVIGTCSTQEKADLVKQSGANHTIVYSEQDFVAEVKRLTSGAGVDVVYDSVGETTFSKSLECLKPRGMMVSFGQSSGPVGEIDPLTLSQHGSLFLTRPALTNYISDPAELKWRSEEIFGWMADGKLKVKIYKTFPLEKAADAQRALESRETTGKLLLKP